MSESDALAELTRRGMQVPRKNRNGDVRFRRSLLHAQNKIWLPAVGNG